MRKHEFAKGIALVVIADEGKYLALKNVENSEELIGRPTRVMLEKAGIVPEFEEREVIE